MSNNKVCCPRFRVYIFEISVGRVKDLIWGGIEDINLDSPKANVRVPILIRNVKVTDVNDVGVTQKAEKENFCVWQINDRRLGILKAWFRVPEVIYRID